MYKLMYNAYVLYYVSECVEAGVLHVYVCIHVHVHTVCKNVCIYIMPMCMHNV